MRIKRREGAEVCEQNWWSSEMNFLYRSLSIFLYFNRWHKCHKHRHTLARSSPAAVFTVVLWLPRLVLARRETRGSSTSSGQTRCFRRAFRPDGWTCPSLRAGQLLPGSAGDCAGWFLSLDTLEHFSDAWKELDMSVRTGSLKALLFKLILYFVRSLLTLS